MTERSDVFSNLGWFDDPSQTKPAHNPCFAAACPACGKPNGEAGISHRCLMPAGSSRSYFFLFHSACQSHPAIARFASRAIDEIMAWEGVTQ